MHFNIPFVLFTLNLLALNAHGQHAGDVILAVNDAATITTSTIAATGVVTARACPALQTRKWSKSNARTNGECR